ncbi:MAG: HvfC/BufC family peptide modification chaperone [Sulfuriferula sp.]
MNTHPFPPAEGIAQQDARAHTALADEARRQRELVEAVFSAQISDTACAGVRQSGAQWRAGLAAYRGNGLAHARNALRVQFPTVLAMLGEEAFDVLCAHYWRACPPRRGDLAWVGEELPEFIVTLQALDDWPWLGDCARLDWAIWQIASAAPARLDEDDLRRLVSGDPQKLRLQLAGGVRRVASAWPVVTLYLAHHQQDTDWDEVTQAIQHRQAQTAWAWRPQAGISSGMPLQPLDTATDRWIVALNQGMSLETALDLAGDDFDFVVWLDQAARQGWLDAVMDLNSS